MKPQPHQSERVALVSGPATTEQELVDLVYAGAKVATINGARRTIP